METVRIGWGAADISPVEFVPLAGFGNTETRMSQQVLHPLRAHCPERRGRQHRTDLYAGSDRRHTEVVRGGACGSSGSDRYLR